MILLLITIFINLLCASQGVREVSTTSCEVIKVNLGLGMTTQVILEQEPQVILYADKTHFKISTNSSASRSLAIIPFISSSELDAFRNSKGFLPDPAKLASTLNNSFRTNMFVFFKNNNQLMFELEFTEKKKADYILKVSQIFKEDCSL